MGEKYNDKVFSGVGESWDFLPCFLFAVLRFQQSWSLCVHL